MIIDSFMFFNELDILEGRLEYLYDHIDYFVIVEANITHSGRKKPLYFLENMSRYKPYLDKIVYTPFYATYDQFDWNMNPVHMDYKSGAWQVENAQRNHIQTALRFFPDDAVVLLSDVDEIPNRVICNLAPWSFNENRLAMTLDQIYLCFNFNNRLTNSWYGTIATTNDYVLKRTPQGLRNDLSIYPVLKTGGWHLSYWGGVERVKTKIESFAHQEFNTENFTDTEKIQSRIQAGTDPFDRGQVIFEPPRPGDLPEEIVRIFGRYQHLPG